MEREDIIAKIRKLLRLQYGAEKIGSSGEAYQAAKMVQKLLLEYNLQMSDIEPEREAAPKIVESDGITYADEYGNTWKLQLLNIICEFNLCRCLYTASTRKMNIIGTEANVIVCREFYQYLTKVFSRLSMERLHTARQSVKGLQKDIEELLALRSADQDAQTIQKATDRAFVLRQHLDSLLGALQVYPLSEKTTFNYN